MTVHKSYRLKYELFFIIGLCLILLLITLGGQGWPQYLRLILGIPFFCFFLVMY